MRVTSKGQVTIPLAVRNRYGIMPGAEVEFVEGDQGPEIRVRRTDSAHPGDLVLALRAARRHVVHHMSTDEMMEMMRGGSDAEDIPR